MKTGILVMNKKKMLFVLLLIVILLVPISMLSGGVAYAATSPDPHDVIGAKTILNNHQQLFSNKVVSAPESMQPHRVPPPEEDCITIWGYASNIQKFGVVASYDIKANLWNTCGVALKGSDTAPTSGWTVTIDIQCEGVWIEQGSLSGKLPALNDKQQLLPLLYYNFKSTCVDAVGNVSLPEAISVAVVASSVRTDNNNGVTGGADITVY